MMKTMYIALICAAIAACGTDKRALPPCDALGCGMELLCSSKELCHCDGQACTP